MRLFEIAQKNWTDNCFLDSGFWKAVQSALNLFSAVVTDGAPSMDPKGHCHDGEPIAVATSFRNAHIDATWSK